MAFGVNSGCIENPNGASYGSDCLNMGKIDLDDITKKANNAGYSVERGFTSPDAGRITFIVEMNKSALVRPYKETQTDGKSYPDMSFTYRKPSTCPYIGLVCFFMLLFILSAIVTLVLVVLMREYPDS